MRIGIFGGSFNPPHKMHEEISITLLEKNYLDKIIYVPTGNNYNKAGLLNGKDRIYMLKVLFEKYKKNQKTNSKLVKDESKNESKNKYKIEVSDFEVQGSLYTINTLKHFEKIYPDDEIYFICGTDNLAEIYTWRSYEEILKNYKLLVIARNNNDFNDIIKTYSKYSENIILANIKMQTISSTKIRQEILKNGYTKKLNRYLDNKVIEYLKMIDVVKVWNNLKV